MNKIKSFDELQRIRDEVRNKINLREKGEHIEDMIKVRVGMATCGIASGARQTMNTFIEELDSRGIGNAVVTQGGCMGYCHSEPTVEVTLPGREPVIFGNVNSDRVREIIDKYIINGELIDGILPVAHRTV